MTGRICLRFEQCLEWISEELLEEVETCLRQLAALEIFVVLHGVGQPRHQLGDLASKIWGHEQSRTEKRKNDTEVGHGRESAAELAASRQRQCVCMRSALTICE